jgi:hypothetical protein
MRMKLLGGCNQGGLQEGVMMMHCLEGVMRMDYRWVK